jgi:ryanodine receptor 2
VYRPKPIPTAHIELPEEIASQVERLAAHNHDIWALQRLADAWTWGPQRDDAAKRHPCLVPYEELPDSEKRYDRNAATQTIKAVLALGFRIVRD